MKRILFIVNSGEISLNKSGGSSVYYSHLELLYMAGYEIVLLAVQWSDDDKYFVEDYSEIESFIEEKINYKIETSKPSKGISRFLDVIVNPSKFEYSFLNKNNYSFLNEIIKNNSINIIWAEWRWAGILAVNSNLQKPIVYSHHDWEYKLAKIRKKLNLLEKFHNFQKKRVEFLLVRKADCTVSGSFTETDEIKKIGSKSALYIPTTYKNMETVESNSITPSIIHLGGMNTTANRIGLERFLDVCWPQIKKELPNIRLKVVGSLNMASETLLEKLNDPNIDCLGFVSDLNTVLLPEDIHIIPWENNTGTRTRVPVALNYRQVLVATKASVSCFPEINEENSVLCGELSEMIPVIINLYSDREKLHLLSSNGKKTFLETFVANSQVNKLKKHIDTL